MWWHYLKIEINREALINGVKTFGPVRLLYDVIFIQLIYIYIYISENFKYHAVSSLWHMDHNTLSFWFEVHIFLHFNVHIFRNLTQTRLKILKPVMFVKILKILKVCFV